MSPDSATVVGLLGQLVGRWSGTARISWPGRDPFDLTHTEIVRSIAGGSMITIEGNSFRDGVDEPVFSALAVIYDSDEGPQLHAFRGGDAIQVNFELSSGRYAWSVPDPAGTVDYVAEFAARTWTERGTMMIEGEQLEVFVMELTPGEHGDHRPAGSPPG